MQRMLGGAPTRHDGVDAEQELRQAGWLVAVHNTFRLNGEPRTYWRWAHPAGLTAEGDGATDAEAIAQAAAVAVARMAMAPAAAALSRPDGRDDEAGSGTAADILGQLAADRWSVAVHNDYVLNGEFRTFWLLTHPTGVWAKGEGANSAEALALASLQARERLGMDAPAMAETNGVSPHTGQAPGSAGSEENRGSQHTARSDLRGSVSQSAADLLASFQVRLGMVMKSQAVDTAELGLRMGVPAEEVDAMLGEHAKPTLDFVARAFHALGDVPDITSAAVAEILSLEDTSPAEANRAMPT